MRDVLYRLPSMSAEPPSPTAPPAVVHSQLPDGQLGDLWRCQCGALWRIGDACDACDWDGEWPVHDGGHAIGVTWRPATLWQRTRYWKRGRT
jgi:hypothetical protein